MKKIITPFEVRLIELQNELIELKKGNMRLKVNQKRKREITKEFFEVKKAWRKSEEV